MIAGGVMGKIIKDTIHANGIDIGIYTQDFENEFISLKGTWEILHGVLSRQNQRPARDLIICSIRNHIWKYFWQMVMFHNTANGATASAMVYSISETAKLNHLRPYYYFRYTLTELPKFCDEQGKTSWHINPTSVILWCERYFFTVKSYKSNN